MLTYRQALWRSNFGKHDAIDVSSLWRNAFMSLTSSMNTALGGMAHQSKRLAGIADTLASAQPATAGASDRADTVDPAAALAGIADAKTLYKANAAVLEAGADLWDVLRIIKRT
jgi:hypothetical protein